MFWVDQDGLRAGLAQTIQVVLCALSATGAPARDSHSAKHLTSNNNPSGRGGVPTEIITTSAEADVGDSREVTSI